jgi:phage tail sheath gpL-like
MSDIISQPDIDFTITPAQQIQSTDPQRVLLVGQQTAAATSATGELQTEIGNDSSVWEGLFGEDAMLSGMIRAAKVINGQTRFDAIGLDDAGAGTAATGTVSFITGPASEDGTFTVTIGSDRNHKYELAITDTDAITAIGDDLVTAITADTKAPFSAVNAAGVVTITAGHKGTVGNGITLKVEGVVAGITHSVAAMSSGATDPTLTTLFDVIDGERYQTIIWPSEYGYTAVTDELDPRFNTANDILDGVAVSSKTDTLANLKTAGNAENSLSLEITGNNIVNDTSYKGSALIEFDYIIASQLGAVRSLRLTDGAIIARYVISTFGARDNFGGAAISSLPYFNTPFFELPIVPIGKGFTAIEVEELQDAGISVLGNNRAKNTVIAGEIVTTRKTDSGGNPEDTFKFLNNVDTSVAIRGFMFNNLKSRFAQSRLTEGDLVPNRSMANQGSIEAFIDSLYILLSGEDYVLTQAGSQAVDFFKANRTVTLNMLTGTATVVMKTPIVVQLRKFIVPMQISFSTEN